MRGHIDIKVTLLMLAIFVLVATEAIYRQRTGNDFLSAVPLWVWLGLAVAAVLFVLVLAWLRMPSEPRVEVSGGRTVIHFDGRSVEVQPGAVEVRRWTSGGAFGQPLVRRMSLMRGAEVLYEGPESEAERLLALYQELAGKA